MLNRLIRGAIQTGVFASAFALGDLISFVLYRNTNLYAMFAYPIGRIYTNVSLSSVLGGLHILLTLDPLDAARYAQLAPGSEGEDGIQCQRTERAFLYLPPKWSTRLTHVQSGGLQERFRTNNTRDNIQMRRIEVQTEVHTVHDTASRDDKFPLDGEVYDAPRAPRKSSSGGTDI